MTTLKRIIEENKSIPYGEIATSLLAQDAELCREIQQILFENNFYRFEIDGIYGEITREALRDFKDSYALTGGDVLGSTTAEFLLKINKPDAVGSNYDFDTRQGTQQAIVSECRKQGLTLNTQIAYVLATVQHETANTFKPVREAFWKSEQWRKDNLVGYYPYYGRGYVQLTHKSNYKKYSGLLAIDLVADPELALQPNTSLFILIDGMAKGRFTGKRIGSYINASKTDFVEARRVVNGRDKAHPIAMLAEGWLSKIDLLESEEVTESFEIPLLESENAIPDLSEELLLLFKQVMSS